MTWLDVMPVIGLDAGVPVICSDGPKGVILRGRDGRLEVHRLDVSGPVDGTEIVDLEEHQGVGYALRWAAAHGWRVSHVWRRRICIASSAHFSHQGVSDSNRLDLALAIARIAEVQKGVAHV